MDAVAQITSVTLACADPQPLAAFYGAVTGWKAIYSGDDAVFLAGQGDVRLGCERVVDFQAPPWDRHVQPRLRLDLAVDDLAEAERRLVELGASRPGHDLDNDLWIFLADPVGHPLCLTVVS
ncbi:MAG: VOC family protein [Chloroflexi bacterium]|nr:VOC family protein [Chloroflexota bacterium]